MAGANGDRPSFPLRQPPTGTCTCNDTCIEPPLNPTSTRHHLDPPRPGSDHPSSSSSSSSAHVLGAPSPVSQDCASPLALASSPSSPSPNLLLSSSPLDDSPPEEDVRHLLDWYNALRPSTVDLVGDIAGREPFIIHGESLLRHCLKESHVNFDNGCQILHAVYAVERFLGNLQKRGCDFDIVFFRELRHLCVPTRGADAAKYQLARTVILKHLQRHARLSAKEGTRAAVIEFDSPEQEAFVRYLEPLPVHFVLCHAGAEDDDKDAVQLRRLIYNFVSGGKNVAILNNIEWLSSKVYAPLIGRCSTNLRPISIKKDFDSMHTPKYQSPDEAAPGLPNLVGFTARELLGISACCFIVKREAVAGSLSDKALHQRIQAYLLHLAVLRNCTLLERQGWLDTSAPGLAPLDADFFAQVIEVMLFLTTTNSGLFDDIQEKNWDLFDIMDGSIFASVLGRMRRRDPFPHQIMESWIDTGSASCSFSPLMQFVLNHEIPSCQAPKEDTSPASFQVALASALPFNHSVLDEFLKGINLKERKETEDETADLVFRDLHHWHSTKPLDPIMQRRRAGFFARRRNQKLLADILTYSASLTNTKGKLIDPEIIVVKQQPPQKTGDLITKGNGPHKSKQKKDQGSKKKGGKADAIRAAQEVQERKELARHANVVAHWNTSCASIQSDQVLVNQYLRTTKFLFDRSKLDLQILGPDVHLYLIHILGKIWADFSSQRSSTPRSGLHLVALIWNDLQRMSTTPASKAVVKAVEELLSVLKLPRLPVSVGTQSHPLCFKFDFKAVRNVPKSIVNNAAFQLEYAGPYMERRFDSRPDDRVPFDPDAWQRKVLDTIDADNSVLVLAPTSAGKTFISFYAMKKVLEESDDGVLVYVAPTKALVNQIAAEIGARFTKSYEQPGKSVWAIYTRDYRIQSPTGCQILVTVPHMLQIMLLAPENARNANSWCRRIKRIIFDEVHCIGQTQEGVVWEQLLLMAPCPIIALSATIGNPLMFRDWLAMVQERKGLKLELVVHTSRYSDLRKFIYRPLAKRSFTGFNVSRRIAVPGLDEGNESCERFCFVHPVAALTDRNRYALHDLSLEPRDCLKLLDIMKTALSKSELADCNVPGLETLPTIIAKSDVAQWEVKLKAALRRIMETKESVFYHICDLLKPALENKRDFFVGDTFEEMAASLFNLIHDLHDRNCLPVLVFNYNIHGCERTIEVMLKTLLSSEEAWKSKSIEWGHKMAQFEQWKSAKEKQPKAKGSSRSKDKSEESNKSMGSKLEQMRDEASVEASPWESFNPDAPLEQFSLADTTKLLPSEVDVLVKPLKGRVPDWMLEALWRGLGVHHSGLNRQYRQVVEIMFRKGYLRVVVATGTLALGINMPCKTVIFHRDSIFLTAQNYQQASGRAGRRGFDLLGNVVFHGIPRDRVFEIMSARIPGLTGQFPLSTTLVLRLLTLLHGSKNDAFAVTMVQSLLSQTRLFLGGPEAALSVKHHLRFSVEYLRRQRLLRSDGAPINFAGLVGHLYFTENSVFAFHSLVKGGYFHRLCAHIDENPERVLLEMMLVLCHVFKRLPITMRGVMAEKAHRSSSVVFLPRLPPTAERLLIAHNRETLSIFQDYVQSYISHSLADKRDRELPYTRAMVGRERPCGGGLSREATHMVRSPFVALSGLGDEFGSIHELCETVRSDVFLEESAIPYIPVWPHDSDTELNAYIYDFWKHGSMDVLVRDNGIRRGDVWFHLQDFSRTLATIAASIATLMGSDSASLEAVGNADDDWDPEENGPPVAATIPTAPEPHEKVKETKAKTAVVDDWRDAEDDDDDDDDESEEASSTDGGAWCPASSGSEWETEEGGRSDTGWQRKGGLRAVLKAFEMLRDEFDVKFRKTWA